MLHEVGAAVAGTDGRLPTTSASAFSTSTDGWGARGDFTRVEGWRFVQSDRQAAESSALNHLAGSSRQRISEPISSLARRPKTAKLARNPRLRAKVERWLAQRWSPEQIAHRLKLEHPDGPEMHVSHETIYRSLFVQARGALRKELTAYLRTRRTRRHSRRRLDGAGRLRNMVSIAERPPEASDRAIPGHWEGDLILGEVGHSAIGGVVERRSLYVLLLHLPDGRGAPEVRRVLAEPLTALPNQLRCTLTWDQGKVRWSQQIGQVAKVYSTD